MNKKMERYADCFFGYATMPIWLSIHVSWFILLALTKPLHLLDNRIRRKRRYYIEGEFNLCAYLWSEFDPRFPKDKR